MMTRPTHDPLRDLFPTWLWVLTWAALVTVVIVWAAFLVWLVAHLLGPGAR